MTSIDGHPILKVYEDVFGEILGLPSKRDIEFSIDLAPRVSPMSQTPYRIRTSTLKEL